MRHPGRSHRSGNGPDRVNPEFFKKIILFIENQLVVHEVRNCFTKSLELNSNQPALRGPSQYFFAEPPSNFVEINP